MFGIIVLLLPIVNSYKFLPHPLEKRISYVEGIRDVRDINKSVLGHCKIHFEEKSPMLIFKNQPPLTPNEFLDFAKLFDDNRDEDALNSNNMNQSYWKMNQMLQPFDQFPKCKHVAPRGNYFLEDYYGCNNLQIHPSDYFKDKYLWHSDTWAHNSKIMNTITAFYIVKQPLIGGETDFISGETIYEKLSEEEKLLYENLIMEISRESFLKELSPMDYSGAEFDENFEYIAPSKDSISYTPLIIKPEINSLSQPSLIITPIIVQKIQGLSVENSRKFIKNLVNDHLLPNRVTIQWKEGDIAIFNNKLFIHSSTPANNYLNNKFSNERFLLQTFIPTKN